jgi:DNA-binding transcriptional ArsR family regulator
LTAAPGRRIVNRMVNHSEMLDAAFAALADPTRRAILARLADGETTVSALAEPFSMSLPAVLKHLDALERAGLLTARKEGRVRTCRLEPAPLSQAADWIEHYRTFWEGRLEALDHYLTGHQGLNVSKEDDRWRRTRSASRASSRRRAKKSSAPLPRRKR